MYIFTSSEYWTLNEFNLCKINILWYPFFTSISVFWDHFKSEEIIVPSSLVSVTISSRVFSRYSRVENWKSLVKLKIITLLFFTLSLDLLASLQFCANILGSGLSHLKDTSGLFKCPMLHDFWSCMSWVPREWDWASPLKT